MHKENMLKILRYKPRVIYESLDLIKNIAVYYAAP